MSSGMDKLLGGGRGAKSQLARSLGLTPGAVSQWFAKGRIPVGQLVAVEKATGIPREELRPELYVREGGSPPNVDGDLS